MTPPILDRLSVECVTFPCPHCGVPQVWAKPTRQDGQRLDDCGRCEGSVLVSREWDEDCGSVLYIERSET